MILKDWTMIVPHHDRFDVEGRYPCTVPFSMYQVLLDAGRIEDPFWRENDKKELCLSDLDVTAVCGFEVSAEDAAKSHQILRFLGIDTLCDLYLNDQYLGHTNNMHRTWAFDAAGILTEGVNRLELKFSSPTRYIAAEQAKHRLVGSDDAVSGFGHLRKAHCMFGWDGGPQLPDMGLFRPVELLSYDTDRLTNLMIRQSFKDDIVDGFAKTVTLSISAETAHQAKGCVLSGVIAAPDGTETPFTFTGTKAEITLNDPQLWWPHGYGSQPLYTVAVTLTKDDRVLDETSRTIGIRSLTVSTAKDRWGSEFCFVVNGVKIFAMGADYIPEDSLLPRLSRQRTEKLISDCARANFNSIRVWGGGSYPSDDFYDMCDKYGLVVWQDFMFACVEAYLSEEMTANIKKEFVDNLRRIRHHASLGLLCGNNEMETAMVNWPGYKDDQLARMDYLNLYEHILPDICRKEAPDTFYWPSSPSSGGGFDDPNDENRGDVHYWGAWHGSIPFESYRQYYFRFLSEFGFESFPSMKTIRTFAEEGDLNPFSNVMEDHQKCRSGNGKILNYLSANYLYPYDFPSLVYASQLLQLDAIRLGVEHYRRFRGRCMGSIYWQVNDCWPVASWASVDYFGRWKALMYGSKRFFAPVLLSAHEDGTDVVLSLSNETREAFSGTVQYQVMDTDLNILSSGLTEVSIGTLKADDVVTLDLTSQIKGHERDRLLAFQLLDQNDQMITSSSLIFIKPKNFTFKDPELVCSIEDDPAGISGHDFLITVSAKKYAKYVEIDWDHYDLELSDNDFDLTGTDPQVIKGHSDQAVSKEDLTSDLIVRNVYSIGK